VNLLRILQTWKFSFAVTLLGAMFIASAQSSARAAELVMFAQAGCAWCEAFDREIAPVYGKTEEGQRAPLRRVDISHALPPDLTFIEVERLTPLFVLVDKGREIGRIRGYPGDDHFWGLLGALIKKLDTVGTGGEHARRHEKSLRASG
jgi:alkylhydroperoxidase family enzyme